MLTFSPAQAVSMAYDVVRRHAQTEADQVESAMRVQGMVGQHSPSDPRLHALWQVTRDKVMAGAGTAARHLIVDLDLCAARLGRSLQAGATYRQSAASSHLLGVATLGLRWLGDERFCAVAPEAWATVLPEPTEPAALTHWAESGWSDRFERALAHMKAMRAPAGYALRRAVDARFDPASMRHVADTAFPANQGERRARFVQEERALFRAALADGSSPLDPRLESLCVCADLVHGLGRFVRLASALRAQKPAVEFLYPHLLMAIDELAG